MTTGVVCLGCGICREADEPVVTTLEQNVLQGKVKSGRGWVSHRGLTYVVMDGHTIHMAEPEHAGNWRFIAPFARDEEVRMDIFDAWIEHGNSPVDESYAYMVAPSCSKCRLEGAKRARYVRKEVRVVSNTVDIQEVRAGGRLMIVDWNSWTARIKEL